MTFTNIPYVLKKIKIKSQAVHGWKINLDQRFLNFVSQSRVKEWLFYW